MKSHYIPRTAAGRLLAIAFVFAMLLAQPPIVHDLMNRIEPMVLGVPFLFAYLFAAYLVGIGVLILALRKGV